MKIFRNILCVVETENPCASALERAVALAEHSQGSLTVIDMVPNVAAGRKKSRGGLSSAELQAALLTHHKQALETLIEPYRKRRTIETRVLVGISFLEIIREVLRKEYDLVVKVPEQQGLKSRLCGSDDMQLLRKCPCPVWLIKPQAPKTYRRILAAVDVDDAFPDTELESRLALNRQILRIASAIALADFAELHLVHAWDALGESAMRHGSVTGKRETNVDTYVENVKQHREARLGELMAELGAQLGRESLDYLKPQSHLLKGAARKEIPHFAKQIEADLVVMGTVARTGVPGFIMGNTAETILNHIDSSVLAIKPPGFKTTVTAEN